MFAGCIHPVFASARRRPAAVAERECQSAAVRKKAKKADEKAKIHGAIERKLKQIEKNNSLV